MAHVNGMNGAAQHEALQWKMGLMNAAGRYLTAETFGFKINASGTHLKKKQLWTIEHDTKDDEVMYIKSHLGRYLSADKKGNVRCDSERKESEERFTIEYAKDGSGRWALRSKDHGYYFGGAEDALRCYEKSPSSCEWWTVRLAVHPQVNFRNVNRKKYARLADDDTIHVDRVIPWGPDALLTLEFVDGKYAVKTCDGRYLNRVGTLDESVTKDNLFTLEIKSGQNAGMALKDSTGRYISSVGMHGTMKAGKATLGKDELYTLDDSQPQVYITAHNGKRVSYLQGIDLSANQAGDLTDKETFQVEFDRGAGAWRVRTAENAYWVTDPSTNGVRANGSASSPDGLFEFDWRGDGSMFLKARKNQRYITAKLTGALNASIDSPGDKEVFRMFIINRPILVLRCEHGFLGFKTKDNPKIECNKTTYDSIFVDSNDMDGTYSLKGSNGKYWAVDTDGSINADADAPEPFIIELRGHSRFTIKTVNGNYLKGEQNGITVAKATELKQATQWEY